jgi:hypothetical protein
VLPVLTGTGGACTHKFGDLALYTGFYSLSETGTGRA